MLPLLLAMLDRFVKAVLYSTCSGTTSKDMTTLHSWQYNPLHWQYTQPPLFPSPPT